MTEADGKKKGGVKDYSLLDKKKKKGAKDYSLFTQGIAAVWIGGLVCLQVRQGDSERKLRIT